jgi:peroxiredoxin family protein
VAERPDPAPHAAEAVAPDGGPSPGARDGRLLILAHGGTWDRRFQISSLAASAASAGRGVDLALFFAALRCWVAGRWDALDPEPPLGPARLQSLAMPPLSGMLEPGRHQGLLRVYACSASMRLYGLDSATTQAAVDAILGWQSFSRMIENARSVVTL